MDKTVMRKVPLSKNYGIYISDFHSFGTDAVLLADFATRGKKRLRAADMGTGCGIIPMLMVRNQSVKSVLGIEIQEKAVEQANRTIADNNLGEIFSVINADIRDLPKEIEKGSFDLVCCNPPYKKEGAGIVSSSSADIVARHETECTLADVCAAAAKLLKFSGRLCICQRPERLADIFSEMRKVNIEPKRLRTVSKTAENAPWLVLVEGRLGGKPNMEILPPLVVYENGKLSREMIEIYGDYKEGHGDTL